MSGVSNTEPLRRLLRESAGDASSRDLEARVRGRRGKSWLNKIQNAEHRPSLLSEEDLEILADAYRIPRRRIREADLEGHGLEERGEQPRAWIAEDEVAFLSEKQRVAIRFVIEAMRDAGGEAAGDVRPFPASPVAPGGMPRAARTVDRPQGRALREEQDRQQEAPPPVPEDET
jgi:hypothetical protein